MQLKPWALIAFILFSFIAFKRASLYGRHKWLFMCMCVIFANIVTFETFCSVFIAHTKLRKILTIIIIFIIKERNNKKLFWHCAFYFVITLCSNVFDRCEKISLATSFLLLLLFVTSFFPTTVFIVCEEIWFFLQWLKLHINLKKYLHT